MRTKEEIEEQLANLDIYDEQRIENEILLDIRELLIALLEKPC